MRTRQRVKVDLFIRSLTLSLACATAHRAVPAGDAGSFGRLARGPRALEALAEHEEEGEPHDDFEAVLESLEDEGAGGLGGGLLDGHRDGAVVCPFEVREAHH